MSGIPSWAVRGARVVCIDASGFEGDFGDWGGTYPVLNGVYTIRGFDTDFGGFLLVEIPGPAAWSYRRFKPAVTARDDLEAHFTSLLHQPVSIKEPA